MAVTVLEGPCDVRLRDGRVATLRVLSGRDSAALAAFLAAADPVDLRRRFMGLPPPTASLLAQLRGNDGVHDLALGAFDAERLVAVAQFDRIGDSPVAEIAIEVAGDWQRDGLGTALLDHLASLALFRGVHRFTAMFLADNFGIRRLLRDTGRMVDVRVDEGEGYAELDLDVSVRR